ncbi:MAG: hypothetical protein WBX15_18590 [Thermoanaerobaculia bacterium]
MELSVRSAFCAVQAAVILLSAAAALAAEPLTIPYQLTYTENFDPTLSPDGKRMIYGSLFEGREQLFMMNADGRGQRLITHDDADHEDPAWSPDGKRIAFVLLSAGRETIYTMNTDGSGRKALTPDSVRAIHPRWSPDGRSIIYCTDDDLHPPKKNAAEIDVVDPSSGKITTLLSGGVNTYPSWSPDGKQIAFRRMIGDTNSEVFVADASGNHVRNLSNHPAFDAWPEWSPDGSEIAFASNRRGRYQIFVMNSDGSNVRLVANTEGRATAPRWSPDGKTLYFTNCVARDYGTDCQILVSRLRP